MNIAPSTIESLRSKASRKIYQVSATATNSRQYPRKIARTVYKVPNKIALDIDDDKGVVNFTRNPTLKNFESLLTNGVDITYITKIIEDDRINNIGMDYELSDLAVRTDRLDVLKYLYESENYMWHTFTCSTAAEYGRLDCLRYLHEKECPWDEETVFFAASRGHVDCLEYALAKGCLFNADLLEHPMIDDDCREILGNYRHLAVEQLDLVIPDLEDQEGGSNKSNSVIELIILGGIIMISSIFG